MSLPVYERTRVQKAYLYIIAWWLRVPVLEVLSSLIPGGI